MIATKRAQYAMNINTGMSSVVSGSDASAPNNGVLRSVSGLSFSNATVRSFVATVTVSIVRSSGGNLFETFTLEGIQKASSWELVISSVGDNTETTFSITSSGQVQHTTAVFANWTSTTIRYSANQMLVSGSLTGLASTTMGSFITSSLQISDTTDAVSGVSNGGLYLLGGATVEKSLNVKQNISVANLIATALTTGSLVAANNVVTNSTVTNLVVTNNVVTNNTISNLAVTTAITTANLAVGTLTAGNLRVPGALTAGNLTVPGALTAGNLTVPGALTAGNLTVPGTLTVTNITVNNLVQSNGSLVAGPVNTVGNIFTTGGCVGIGTTAPTNTLDVRGGNISVTSTFGTNISINPNVGAFASIEAFTTGNTAKLPLCLNAYGGNVGIGTINPSSTLDVNGSIKTSSVPYRARTVNTFVTDANGYYTLFINGWTWGAFAASYRTCGLVSLHIYRDAENQNMAHCYLAAGEQLISLGGRNQIGGNITGTVNFTADAGNGVRYFTIHTARANTTYNYTLTYIPFSEISPSSII